MITFIKIVFAWKLDNKPSYHRAPAVQFDNNQHLQIYFSKYTPPHKMLQALQNATATGKKSGNHDSWSLSKNKTNKTRKLFYPLSPTKQ